MKKPIKHILISTGMDTLCGIDTELIDKYGVPHKPTCEYESSYYEELEETPIQDGYSYEELKKIEFEDKVICRKCIDELGALMKQYTNLLNG